MAKWKQCAICKDYGWFGTDFLKHRCQSVWECRMAIDADDEWIAVRARNSESAAERAASEYNSDSGEYPIIRDGESVVVFVRAAGSDQIERWKVYGEMVPSYSAERDDEDEDDAPEQEANARLIAAAPDMLAALKNAIARADAHVGEFPEGRHPDCKKDYDVCVAAIKKAEGK